VSGPPPPLRRREGHKAGVPFFARRVPVEVQGQMPFMSIRRVDGVSLAKAVAHCQVFCQPARG
jgi:hypothetical protein